MTSEIILNLIRDALLFSVSRNIPDNPNEGQLKEVLREDFNKSIQKMEKKAQRRIRQLFKHNIFNYDLPAHSILHEDLFSEKTWQVLGLTPKQLLAAAAITGGAVGAALDLAAAGLTFGIFTTIGGLAGAGWTALGGGKRLAGAKLAGLNLGGHRIQIGPINNVQFMYVIMDRILIFYSHIINWAHGRRDYRQKDSPLDESGRIGFTSQWDSRTRRRCQAFFNSLRSGNEEKKIRARRGLKRSFKEILLDISM